jgi:CRP-like cAMP-binding protein
MFSDTHVPKSLRQILSQYCVPTEELIRDMEKVARLVSVEKGQYVVRQGSVCGDFVFNRRGLFRVCNVTDGVEDTILFGTSGDVFTSLHSYYAHEPSIFSLMAVEDSEVWLISYAEMRELEEKHPVLISWMRGLLIEQTYSFEKRYIFFSNKSAEERFLNFLRMSSGTLRRTSVKYISGIVPLKYIAQYLKITQSTLSRLRKKLVSSDR